MGYYLQTTEPKGKADIILKHIDHAEEISQEQAFETVDEPPWGVIVVVDNGPFEAAAYAYNKTELLAFTQPNDPRPKRFLVIPRDDAEHYSGFNRPWGGVVDKHRLTEEQEAP